MLLILHELRRDHRSWQWSNEQEPKFMWSKQLKTNTRASARKRVSCECSLQSKSWLVRNKVHSSNLSRRPQSRRQFFTFSRNSLNEIHPIACIFQNLKMAEYVYVPGVLLCMVLHYSFLALGSRRWISFSNIHSHTRIVIFNLIIEFEPSWGPVALNLSELPVVAISISISDYTRLLQYNVILLINDLSKTQPLECINHCTVILSNLYTDY